MAEKVRAHAVIEGIVQGVFFRVETLRAAENRGVNGWVRNRRDGSVEATFEGDKEGVDSILEWCRQGPARAVVNNVEVKWEEYVGEYTDFKITY